MYAKIDRGWEGMVWGSTAHGRQNTDFLKGNEVKFYRPPEPAANSIYLGFSQWVFTVTKCGRIVTVATNLAGHMKASMDNHVLLTLPAEYAPCDEYKIFSHATQDGHLILVGIYNNGHVRFNNMGKEINSWLARWCITYIARE